MNEIIDALEKFHIAYSTLVTLDVLCLIKTALCFFQFTFHTYVYSNICESYLWRMN